jgi:nucleoside-diphosphate-sugar epimerase
VIVAITGGSGFIGRRLATRHLRSGDTVRVLSRRPSATLSGCDWHQGDLLRDDGALERFSRGADVLYHCAAEVRDRVQMRTVNVNGTRNLLRAASGQIGRWVGLSSVGVYGTYRHGVVTEATPIRPRGAYESSKAEADEWTADAARDGRLALTLLRPSIVYGPDMPNGSLFRMIDMIVRGWFFFIGAPGASANYVHVENVVEALLLCATCPAAEGRVYNLSDWCTIEQFVAWICSSLPAPMPRLRAPLWLARLASRAGARIPGFPLTPTRVDALSNRSVYSSVRIERELGYRPLRSLEAGLRDLVGAWRTRK